MYASEWYRAPRLEPVMHEQSVHAGADGQKFWGPGASWSVWVQEGLWHAVCREAGGGAPLVRACWGWWPGVGVL